MKVDGGSGTDADADATIEPMLPDEAWVTALASLDQMGPARLAALLESVAPNHAWDVVAKGRARAIGSARLITALGSKGDRVIERWQQQASRLAPAHCWQRHVAAGVGVTIRSSAAYPAAFVDDIEPPSILFTHGDPDHLVGPRVAIVGTRDCTRYGYDVARRLAAELAEAGVSIVSGLALGIDGAGHAGALEAPGAPPIAVVGSGLDVIYPPRHARLWRRVVEAGVVLSEYPLGSRPLAWHFPARNRLIAALADVVVVVESPVGGGSMHTVDEAVRRNVDVLAVPGPVTSKVSAGTNKLLFEGAGVARDATDVLVRLGMSNGGRRRAAERRVAPDPGDRPVLDAFDWQPATFDHLVLRTGIDLVDLTLALDRLLDAGWIEQRGGWYERVAKG
jgi:DNA processing protein